MICVNIVGGLGNQMFQYAFGQALSSITNSPVGYIDDMFTSYKTTHNGSELEHVFDISLNKVTKPELAHVLGTLTSQPLFRRMANNQLIRYLMPKSFLHEDRFDVAYMNQLVKQGQSLYLQGYWQNYKYAASVRENVLRSFTFSKPLLGLNLTHAMTMNLTESVSLHVRRGDYISNPRAQVKHGVLPIEYYVRAIELIRDRTGVSELMVFAFSDDLEWVSNTLKTRVANLILVEGNSGGNAHFDMHLMSKCKHHIICNSTFSWWGAWLDRLAKGIVVAPKHWFADGTDATSLIPRDWCRI